MSEKEIFELEKDNYTTIHLHLVGIFWRAYQYMERYKKNIGGM